MLAFRRRLTSLLTVIVAALVSCALAAQPAVEVGSYSINAGDGLSLQVWNEATLSADQLLVRPDGFISVPVLGEMRAGGRTVSELQDAIAEGLTRYLKDKPTVVVSVTSASGSLVFVLGKVVRPGAFPMTQQLDVTQALALAGGLNSFAASNSIKILRRDSAGIQRSIKFRYGKVKDGDDLSSNILLKSGDIVLVP